MHLTLVDNYPEGIDIVFNDPDQGVPEFIEHNNENPFIRGSIVATGSVKWHHDIAWEIWVPEYKLPVWNEIKDLHEQFNMPVEGNGT
jgi:hypothetical protein